MKSFLISLTILFTTASFGQNQGNNWYFGNQAGLDFNTTPPTPLFEGQTNFPLPLQWNEGSSSISDIAGNLLFYTNGMKIWNSLHQTMANGNNLMGHSSSTQSALIVPLPNSTHIYVVFTTDGSENNFQNGLRYSVVNMNLQDGLGAVIEKNIELLDNVSEKLIGIKHCNGTDYWIVTHKYNSDAFYSFRLTGTGIIDTVISNTGTIDPQGWGGQMVASPNGQKIAYAIPNAQNFGKTLLLDFDASTGIVSNEQILSTGGREWGASFSPDNSKLYFSTAGFGEMFQYDLNAGDLSDIIASKTYIIQNGPDSWRHHQLGPDGKIYISRSAKLYLSVIDNPNSSCPSCNYIDSAIYLGGRMTSFGLPNFITAYDYQPSPYQCTTGLTEVLNTNIISIYPNPFSLQTTIEANILLRNATLTIMNNYGKSVKEIENISGQTYTLSGDDLPRGLYYIRLIQDDSVIATEKIIIMD